MIQLQFLNYILDTKDTSLILVNNLDASYFSDYEREFNFIKNHLNEYSTVPDKETFITKFPDFDIIEVHESSKYLIDELYKDKNHRFLADTFMKMRDLLNAGKIDEAMDLSIKSSEIAVQAKHLEAVNIVEDLSRYDAYVDRRNDYSKFYIKTGFKELDTLIGGWDRQEELATIVARPGVGKSFVALKCAVAALEQGLRVGLYSGEMSEQKVGYRFDSIVSHISNYSISKGKEDVQHEYRRYIESLKGKYKDGFLKVLTPAMINGPAGVTALRAFIEKENLDILFVDQHSLLEDDRRARNPVERASNISKDLKNLQVLKKIPIIAVSQQNRAATDENEIIDVSRIAQADRIGQDSTVVLFIEQKDGIMTLTLAKSRDSESGKKLKYAVDLNKGIFDYLSDSEDSITSAEATLKLKNKYDSADYIEEEQDVDFQNE